MASRIILPSDYRFSPSGGSPFSLAFWFKMEADVTFQTVFCNGAPNGNNFYPWGWTLSTSGTGRFHWHNAQSNGSSGGRWQFGSNMIGTGWRHFVLSKAGAGTPGSYVDGVFDSAFTLTGGGHSDCPTAGQGALPNLGTKTGIYSAFQANQIQLREMAFFNYALSAGDAVALVGGGPNSPPNLPDLTLSGGDPFAYYPFAVDTLDYSGNGLHGIPTDYGGNPPILGL